MGGARDSAARRSVYGSRALWSIQIWPCMGGARAGHPSASGCGCCWRARSYSNGNSRWSVIASAGFTLKSGDRLYWNLIRVICRRMGVAMGVIVTNPVRSGSMAQMFSWGSSSAYYRKLRANGSLYTLL